MERLAVEFDLQSRMDQLHDLELSSGAERSKIMHAVYAVRSRRWISQGARNAYMILLRVPPAPSLRARA
jgi:hypothetical protein